MYRCPKILIVEDEAFIRKTIQFIISNMGYEVAVAENGKQGLEAAREHVFDLIISDINMPEMDGNTFVQQLRSFSEYKMVPFIFLTGNSEAKVWAKSLQDGADDYLTKPFEPEVLVAKVKANLKRALLRKAELDYRITHHLNFEQGTVVFCIAEGSDLRLPEELISAEILNITNDAELFSVLNNDDIWLLIIDEMAHWAFEVIEKTQTICSSLCLQPTVLLKNPNDEEKIESFFELGCEDLVFKKRSDKILAQEINARIEREAAYKYKYLNALNLAAKNSPIRLENAYEYSAKNVSLSCFHQAFESLPGGDFYDVFKLNEDEQLVVVGDVMGKKWGAWFFVMAYIAYIRCAVRFFANGNDSLTIRQPEKLLEALNKYVYKDMQLSEVFTTLVVVFVNHKESTVKMASAGGLRPMLFRKAQNKVVELEVGGILLGLLEEANYKTEEVKLAEDDSILIFTDGYSEANAENSTEMIGSEGVEELFLSMNREGLQKSSEFDDQFVKQANVRKFDDDRTLLFIKKTA